jgi:hypothetical protein
LFSGISEGRLMKRIVIPGISLIVAIALANTRSNADEPEPGNKLIGTWKLVSAKYDGQDFKFAEGTTTVKHVTPTQFMWASYDVDGKVSRAAGGSYTLKGVLYEETPEYGLSADFEGIKGKVQSFKCRVDGNKWFHDGKLSGGVTIEEVWERVERK